MGNERWVIMPRQFWIPKHHAKMETTPGEAKNHSHSAARKGDAKCMTPYESQVKTSRTSQRSCVRAWRMFRAKGGRAARMESFGLWEREYIHVYPATAQTICANRPNGVMSKRRWSACSR